MKYGYNVLKKNLEAYDNNEDLDSTDIFSGLLLLEQLRAMQISDYDTMIMLSVDGAQLYESKDSDCWMGIATILNLPPHLRYTRAEVCPVLLIPGPKKPDNMSSFYYPLLHQVSALMAQGVKLIDGELNPPGRDAHPPLQTSYLQLIFVAADGPGQVTFSGGVGHTGRCSCRLLCPHNGRHKDGVGIYYPVLQKPNNYHVDGCNHADVIPEDVANWQPSEAEYIHKLTSLLCTDTNSQFEDVRLETGLVCPTLLLGLPSNRMTHIPGVFCMDFMHWPALNAPDLLIPLWRGALKFPRNAPWTIHLRTTDGYKEHGALVASLAQYVPGWYGPAPRDPSLKANTDFKAWEWMVYLFTLGPLVFRNYLPREYWKHFLLGRP
jgi:hypothetical protein